MRVLESKISKIHQGRVRPVRRRLIRLCGFMLITRNVHKYIRYLISNYINSIKIPTLVLLNYPEIAKMCVHYLIL